MDHGGDRFYPIIQEQFKLLLVSLVGDEIQKQDANWRKCMVFLVLDQCRMFGNEKLSLEEL